MRNVLLCPVSEKMYFYLSKTSVINTMELSVACWNSATFNSTTYTSAEVRMSAFGSCLQKHTNIHQNPIQLSALWHSCTICG